MKISYSLLHFLWCFCHKALQQGTDDVFLRNVLYCVQCPWPSADNLPFEGLHVAAVVKLSTPEPYEEIVAFAYNLVLELWHSTSGISIFLPVPVMYKRSLNCKQRFRCAHLVSY